MTSSDANIAKEPHDINIAQIKNLASTEPE
jgi:hypothetical protein